MNAVTEVTVELLLGMPLAAPDSAGDKESRGRAVVIGGSKTVPGAVILSGLAALRAGAGKVQLAVPESLGSLVGARLLEAGVLGFAQTDDGHPAASAVREVCRFIDGADAVLIGPGLMEEKAARALTLGVLQEIRGPIFVLDALAMTELWDQQRLLASHEGRVILTPHAGEMASLSGLTKEAVCADPLAIATKAARRLRCTVVLKGAATYIAGAEGHVYCHELEVPGLATAGSGDVLAGIIVGLAARGVSVTQSALFGVYAHAQAARRLGPVGFIASELVPQVPAILAPFTAEHQARPLRSITR